MTFINVFQSSKTNITDVQVLNQTVQYRRFGFVVVINSVVAIGLCQRFEMKIMEGGGGRGGKKYKPLTDHFTIVYQEITDAV